MVQRPVSASVDQKTLWQPGVAAADWVRVQTCLEVASQTNLLQPVRMQHVSGLAVISWCK